MIAVTGASGFLGSATVDECRRRGLDVRPVSLRGEFASAIDDAGAVIPAAGLAHGGGKDEPEEYRKVNVDLTRAVADAAGEARVPRLVLVSSVPMHAGGTPYAGSKREGKCVAADAARRHGTQLVIVRPATIIGEGDPGNSGMKSTRSERFERIACAES